MKLGEIFEESILLLKTNGMRTALSALGIIIGIGSVIALMTLGQASQANIKQRIESLGSNLLIIRPGSQQAGFIRSSGTTKTLKYSDAQTIATSKRLSTVNTVAMDYSARAQISYNRNNANISVTGVAGDYFNLRNIQVESGVALTDQNSVDSDKVVVLGPTAVEDLFGTNAASPIGTSIHINGTSFKVIGVTKSKGSSGFDNQDEVAYIPLQTAQKAIFGVDYLSTIYVGAKSEQVMDAAQNQVGFLLLELHRKPSVDKADFSILNQADILQTANDVTKTFTMLLTGIAAISLIVGGIGIMNIMLVTVTERTTEIGLRKALGAKSKTIVTQFLMEAIVLTISGGMIGVLLGLLTSFILTKVMSLPQTVSYSSIGLAVLVSCTIGIIFGWYPAYKASKLQPIEALRYE